MKRLSFAPLSIALLALFPACLTVTVKAPQLNDPENLGKQIVTGALTGVQDKGATATQQLVAGAGKGLREDILNDETNAKLKGTVAGVVDVAAVRVQQMLGEVNALLATLGKRSQEIGRGISLGAGLALRDDVLGPQMDQRVAALGGALRNQLIGEEANRQVAALGKTIGEAANQVMANAQQHVSETTIQLKAQLDDEQKRVRNALIAVAVVIVLGSCGTLFLYYQLRKHRRLVDVMAAQIEKIPEPHIYDQVVKKIESDAIAAGVNEDLRKRLKRHGYLEEWSPPPSN